MSRTHRATLALLIEEGGTIPQIARRMQMSREAVIEAISLYGLDEPVVRRMRVRDSRVGEVSDRIDQGQSVRLIAKELRTTKDVITKIIKDAGLESPHRRLVRLSREEMVRLAGEGATAHEIAAKVGCSVDNVWQTLRRLGVPVATARRDRQQISMESYRRRVEMINQGHALCDIAAIEGVSRQTMSQWARRHGLTVKGAYYKPADSSDRRKYDYEAVTRIATSAVLTGASPTLALAEEYGISRKSAEALMARARKFGYHIPPVSDRRPLSWRERVA